MSYAKKGKLPYKRYTQDEVSSVFYSVKKNRREVFKQLLNEEEIVDKRSVMECFDDGEPDLRALINQRVLWNTPDGRWGIGMADKISQNVYHLIAQQTREFKITRRMIEDEQFREQELQRQYDEMHTLRWKLFSVNDKVFEEADNWPIYKNQYNFFKIE